MSGVPFVDETDHGEKMLARPLPKSTLGDATCFAFWAFGVCTFCGGAVNTGWYTGSDLAMYGPGFMFGGVAQVLAGVFELIKGDTRGGTIFTAYGLFWLSYAMLLWPGLNPASYYPDSVEFTRFIGVYMCGWAFVALPIWLSTYDTTIAQFYLLWNTMMNFVFLGAWALTDREALRKTAGYFMVVAGVVSWYVGTALFLRITTPIYLPLGNIKGWCGSPKSQTHIV